MENSTSKDNGNKKEKSQHFVLEIFSRKCASAQRSDGTVKPVSQHSYTITGDDWDTYFSVAAIDADDNQYNRAYAYLLQLKDEDDNLVWGDWESDEV